MAHTPLPADAGIGSLNKDGLDRARRGDITDPNGRIRSLGPVIKSPMDRRPSRQQQGDTSASEATSQQSDGSSHLPQADAGKVVAPREGKPLSHVTGGLAGGKFRNM